MHFFFVQADQIGHCGANPCGHLAAHANVQSTLIWIGEYAARLNGQGCKALIDDVQVHHMGCLIERGLSGFGIAVTRFCYTVVGCLR